MLRQDSVPTDFTAGRMMNEGDTMKKRSGILFCIGVGLLGLSSTLWGSAFEKSEYAARRLRLMEKIPDGVAVILGATPHDGGLGYRQNNDFFYFTGVEIPDAVLMMDDVGPDDQVLERPSHVPSRADRPVGPPTTGQVALGQDGQPDPGQDDAPLERGGHGMATRVHELAAGGAGQVGPTVSPSTGTPARCWRPAPQPRGRSTPCSPTAGGPSLRSPGVNSSTSTGNEASRFLSWTLGRQRGHSVMASQTRTALSKIPL